jgi:hypothetical protein
MLTDRYTITYLVPRGAARATAQTMNTPLGNVAEWEQSEQGVEAYTQANNAGYLNYFNSRSVGMTNSKTFYTDLSSVSTKDIKSAQKKGNLVDVTSNFKVLNVDREEEIADFVGRQVGQYVKGRAYYQLTKTEVKVQGSKEILLVEKGSRTVLGNARAFLGFPAGTVRVKPGNHANYDIFVQSTSLNRKLVRGTKVLVRK